MHTRTGQFIIWTLLIACISAGIYRLLKKKNPAFRLGELAPLLGPWYVLAFTIHPLLFEVPSNFAVLKKLGFFGFWFALPDADQYVEHTALIGLLGGASVALFLVLRLLMRSHRTSKREVLLWLALPIWYLAAFCLRYWNDVVLNFANHSATESTIAGVQEAIWQHSDSFYRQAGFSTKVGLGLLIVAVLVTSFGGGKAEEPEVEQ